MWHVAIAGITGTHSLYSGQQNCSNVFMSCKNVFISHGIKFGKCEKITQDALISYYVALLPSIMKC